MADRRNSQRRSGALREAGYGGDFKVYLLDSEKFNDIERAQYTLRKMPGK